MRLPDTCRCRKIDGRAIGFIVPDFFDDGSTIEPGDAEYGVSYPCVCKQPELHAQLRRVANLPPGTWTFSGYLPQPCDPERSRQLRVVNSVERWAQGHLPERSMLVLVGDRGTGKTHLACAALSYLVDHGVHARYEYVPDLFEALHEQAKLGTGGVGAEIDRLRTTPVLCLDDIGVTPLNEWSAGVLDALVDFRYRELAPTILITNAAEGLPARLADRMRDNQRTLRAVMEWPSYRSTVHA